jgi:hypothetical protein
MKPRPYINLQNKQLIKTFEKHRDDPKQVGLIAHEIRHRSKINKKAKLHIYERYFKIQHKPINNNHLIKTEAERAIYLDFECFEDKEPTIMGVLIGKDIHQFIFSNDLPNYSKKQIIRHSTLGFETAAVIETALKENRRIITYSEYDKNKIHKYTELGGLFDFFFYNARRLADDWQKELSPDIKPDNSLKSVAKKIGTPYPKKLTKRGPTERLRKIIPSYEKIGEYSKLPKDIKNEWELLLEYNRWDCEVMRNFFLSALADLEA